MRETRDWADWELEILESYYSLEGGLSVRARLARRGSVREEYSIRHKASRLDLGADMLEFVPAAEVAEEAGVSVQAVHGWLDGRGYRRHCRTERGALLLPAPAVRLYLHERRTATRPRGWWGSARTAEHLNVSVRHLTRLVAAGHLTAAQHGRTMYYDPFHVIEYAAARRYAAATSVPVTTLAALAGISPQATVKALSKAGASLKAHPRPGRSPANYVSADHARQFLTARGHHDEQVETLLRRALQQTAKVSETDREES